MEPFLVTAAPPQGQSYPHFPLFFHKVFPSMYVFLNARFNLSSFELPVKRITLYVSSVFDIFH